MTAVAPDGVTPVPLEVLPLGIVLPATPGFGGPVDVHLNGYRVWSEHLDPELGPVELTWPEALASYLDGTVEVELRDPQTGTVLAAGSGRLGTSELPIEVIDDHGRRLVVNKWGSLGINLAGSDAGLADRMLTRAAHLVEVLRAGGWTSFVVGGTLLGAARSGALLPHDDDVDLAVLMPPESHPSDLVLQSFQLQRLVEAEGLAVVRHSSAHLQIDYLLDDGTNDHYIDIFLAFYRDGYFYEPLAMQVPAEAVTIEPLSSITIQGHELPAPADVEGWLAACYGPGWRTPDPSFWFDVPLRTTRRFWNWFGSYNLHRTFWTGPGLALADEPIEASGVLPLLPGGATVVDLGSGHGAMSRKFADAGFDTLALDFAFPALRAARAIPGVEARRVNLNDTTDVLDLAVDLIRAGRPIAYWSGHTYEGLSGEGKENVLLLLQRTLKPGDVAIFDFYTELPGDFRFEDPTTWHVVPEDLERDVEERGLTARTVVTGRRDTPHGFRRWTRCVITTKTGTENR